MIRMTNSDKKLFVQALSEGIVKKYDEEIMMSDENTECTRQHYKKLSTITGYKVAHGKRIAKKTWVAIILAAALLLTGCTVYVYRNEIRDFFVEMYESFIKLTFDQEQQGGNETIDQIYYPSYIMEEYALTNEVNTPVMVLYEYSNSSGEVLIFEQFLLDGSDYMLDAEKGDTLLLTVNGQDVYYRYTDNLHHYIWNNGKYAFTINSSVELTDDNIEDVIVGIKLKG